MHLYPSEILALREESIGLSGPGFDSWAEMQAIAISDAVDRSSRGERSSGCEAGYEYGRSLRMVFLSPSQASDFADVLVSTLALQSWNADNRLFWRVAFFLLHGFLRKEYTAAMRASYDVSNDVTPADLQALVPRSRWRGSIAAS